MADLRISQLTEVTAPIVTDTLPVVNGGETKRVTINSLSNALPLTTFVQANSSNWGGVLELAEITYAGPYAGGPLYGGDNLINNTDNYLPWDTTVRNTNTNIFELVNPNSANARIAIKQTGTYEITTRVSYFDCYSNTVSVYLDSNTAITGGSWTRLRALNRNWFPAFGVGSPPATMFNSSTVVRIASVPLYISVAVNPTANTPFPDSISGTAPGIIIQRIGGI